MRLGSVKYEIGTDEYGSFSVTVFADSTFVLARPASNHDWVHTWLWYCLFQEPSYTLWKLAHPSEDKDHNLVAYEEAAVLRVEAYLLRKITP